MANQPTKRLRNRNVKIILPFLILLFLWLGLNYRQFSYIWLIKSGRRRLVNLAEKAPTEFQNPPPIRDSFDGKLSPDFWKFTTINGGGQVSHEMAWHSCALIVNSCLTIQHFPDPSFKSEKSNWHVPAADQYNNVSAIGGSGFRPSPSADVVLKFTAWASEKFYGSAGVIVQPAGTLHEDGSIAKLFDMFGFSIIGKESSLFGINGPICYLTLNLTPVHAIPLQVDTRSSHLYEIRLRWISQTEWSGSIKVDNAPQCQVSMPAFGPIEVHVWSDNLFVLSSPRRLWEIAPAMDLRYQDSGDKEFSVGMIEIFEEKR